MGNTRIHKEPTWAADYKTTLKPGDILLFSGLLELKAHSPRSQFLQFGIKLAGDTRNTLYGHSNTTHTAIVVKNENGIVEIIHVTEAKDLLGVVREPLDNMIMRDGGDRPMQIFSPASEEMRAEIVKEAEHYAEKKEINWSRSKAASIIMSFGATKEAPREDKKTQMTTDEVCSSFVSKIINIAAQNIKQLDYHLHVHPNCFPAELEEDLYINKNFNLKIYTGKLEKPYAYVLALFNTELSRLKSTGQTTKHTYLSKIQTELKKLIDQVDTDDFNKARLFIQRVLQPLDHFPQMGSLIRNHEPSYQNVILKGAEPMGIFRRDVVTDFSIDQFPKIKIVSTPAPKKFLAHTQSSSPISSPKDDISPVSSPVSIKKLGGR